MVDDTPINGVEPTHAIIDEQKTQNGAEPSRPGLGEFDGDDVSVDDLPGDHNDVDVIEAEPDTDTSDGPDLNDLPDDVRDGHPDPDGEDGEPEHEHGGEA